MKVGISLKINVSMIEKARLFRGKKGAYLDATVFVDTVNVGQYGDNGMITQDVSKEEKDKGVKGAILGNCKVFWSDTQEAQQAPQQAQPQQGVPSVPHPEPPPMDSFDDDIPF